MRENLCHKIANESLFVGLAVTLLTVIATVAYSLVWPSIVVVFGVRAWHDFSRCELPQVKGTFRFSKKHLQPLKA